MNQIALNLSVRTIMIAALVIFSVSCSQRAPSGGNSTFQNPGGNPPPTNFNPGTIDDFFGQNPDAATPLDPETPVGSGSNGGLTEADQWALKNVFQEQGGVEPTSPNSGLSDYLKQEAMRLLEEERKGKEVAVQKMVLAGKILEECAKKVGPKAPVPGQPLLGLWNSTDAAACKTNFTVRGTGSAGTYSVTGGTKGALKATNVGDGDIQAQPYSGKVTDRPQAGQGTLTHPTFIQTKYGHDPCSTAVALKTSANPIPQNYQEAMKQMGKCFRQAIVLMSPIFDNMFSNMDPQLRQLIQMRMLGFQTGQ